MLLVEEVVQAAGAGPGCLYAQWVSRLRSERASVVVPGPVELADGACQGLANGYATGTQRCAEAWERGCPEHDVAAISALCTEAHTGVSWFTVVTSAEDGTFYWNSVSAVAYAWERER